jgi:hypothetical protein
MLGDRLPGPPGDPAWLELVAPAGVVAPVEELMWGEGVEPALGLSRTAVLFGVKHVAADGRWRRGPGLALFWMGLGPLRRRSEALALVTHVAANAAAVVAGHVTARDVL